MLQVKKIWVIVYRMNESKLELLLLKPNPEPGLVYDYYVITGGIESNETAKQAALRETEEEIGVNPINIFNLCETIEYMDRSSGQKVIEKCFAAEINNSKLVLNEEHVGYRWVSIKDFKKMIWWEGSKNKLNRVIRNLEDTLGA